MNAVWPRPRPLKNAWRKNGDSSLKIGRRSGEWKEECQWRQEEADKRAQEEAKCLAHKEAERKAEEECKAWEAVVRACARCCNKGTPCVLGAAKGKTMACEACHHMKVSCSWTKRMAGELRKWKQVWRSEEAEETEVVDMDKDEDEEALTTTLDMLSMDFLEFWQDSWNLRVAMLRAIEAIANELWRVNNLKEEEMGKSKGKGKEREEGPRWGRTEDKDRDTKMGRAGPSSLA
ncbi:hypothetical protein ID866_10677 [Astraeus odoratus]|nr:hypothetical protein ID866_10677 [Astraeus odoratus]